MGTGYGVGGGDTGNMLFHESCKINDAYGRIRVEHTHDFQNADYRV